MNERTLGLAKLTAEHYPDADVEWIDHLHVRCKGADLLLTQGFDLSLEDGTIILFKDPLFVSAYLELLRGRRIENMVEVGVFNGGSAVFFWNLLKPARLCCIELNARAPKLTDYIADQNLQESFSTYFKTDQSDRARVKEILDEQFGSEPVDLVIDDASHLYGPSLDTFEAVFPRLAPGALYVLEDWRVHFGMPDHGRDPASGEPPVHRLVQELVDVAMVSPETISDVAIHINFAVFTRGEGSLDADTFDIRAVIDAGREHLER